MGNEGTCDYVQYDQHEESRDYNMSSGVMCGWRNVRYLNLTYCDCTKEAGQANNCQSAEGLKMALHGVVCGNCGTFVTDYAYEAIFDSFKPDAYNSECPAPRLCALSRHADRFRPPTAGTQPPLTFAHVVAARISLRSDLTCVPWLLFCCSTHDRTCGDTGGGR